jgi:hypothetical protein
VMVSPRVCSLQYLMDDLVKLDGESDHDRSQHDVVQPCPIGGRIDNVREDIIVTPLLVVGR